MTKSEVRGVCLSKLALTEMAVAWDVGAGTGSVSIEMALQARKGHVYAIERKDAAVEILQENVRNSVYPILQLYRGLRRRLALYFLHLPMYSLVAAAAI